MANSTLYRIQSNAIFKVSTPRKKPKPPIPASQIATYDYVAVLLQAKWNRIRLTR